MSKLEVDAAKPSTDLSVIEKYYERHIANRASPSPSSRTVSSTFSDKRSIKLEDYSGESSTASNSDCEELELDAVPSGTAIEVSNNIDNIASGHQIDNIDIQNSVVQFGNKTFYNGPVVIKQFLLDEKKNKWIKQSPDEVNQVENGTLNIGQSAENNVNGSQFQLEEKQENCNKEFFRIKNYSFKRKSIYLYSSLIFLCVLFIIAAIAFLWKTEHLLEESSLGDGDDSRRNIAINSTIGDDLLLRKVMRLVTRDEWLAQPANEELKSLSLPVNRYIITHTATESCEFQAECTLRVRLIQTYHMESKNWDDIGYNFLVGGDGNVYEGRGWEKEGAHTKGYNSGSIGIAYIGTFNKRLPSEQQLTAGALLMEEGVKLKKVKADYKIYAHRQLISSESPGATFYDLIKTWPHWTNETPKVF